MYHFQYVIRPGHEFGAFASNDSIIQYNTYVHTQAENWISFLIRLDGKFFAREHLTRVLKPTGANVSPFKSYRLQQQLQSVRPKGGIFTLTFL